MVSYFFNRSSDVDLFVHGYTFQMFHGYIKFKKPFSVLYISSDSGDEDQSVVIYKGLNGPPTSVPLQENRSLSIAVLKPLFHPQIIESILLE